MTSFALTAAARRPRYLPQLSCFLLRSLPRSYTKAQKVARQVTLTRFIWNLQRSEHVALNASNCALVLTGSYGFDWRGLAAAAAPFHSCS